MEHQEKIRRSSVAALIGALALSLPFYPYLLFVFALSASDSGTGTGTVVAIFVGAAIGWVILAAYVVRKWLRGWTSVWKIPLVVLTACLFWPALLLLFNQSIRRALLPGRPSEAAAYCVACGAPMPGEALYLRSRPRAGADRLASGRGQVERSSPLHRRVAGGQLEAQAAALLEQPRLGNRPAHRCRRRHGER